VTKINIMVYIGGQPWLTLDEIQRLWWGYVAEVRKKRLRKSKGGEENMSKITAEGITELITQRHEEELQALVTALGNSPVALAKNVAVLSFVTAGRVLGVAQTLHVMQTLKKQE